MAKKNIFAEHEGKLFVRLAAVMAPLIALSDGLTLVFFDKNRKTAYLRIDDAIDWCRREMEYSRKPQDYQLRIDVMEKAKAQLAAELSTTL